MTIAQYIDNLQKLYKSGKATEHSYRGDLQRLIESLVPDIQATNEPKRQACGAPDYILDKKDIPVGFIEAKDIGDADLEGKKKTGNKEQFDRYKASLSNLIFTDYIDFHFYRNGEFITKIAVGKLTEKGIEALPENFAAFENLLKDFCEHVGQTIKSPEKLAKMMAGKARLLADIIGKALTSDEDKQEDSTLKDQMQAFKDILIHDITPQGFADVYAQTIAYGMFAARLHDPTLPTFSRQEAAELIPKTNPFLRKLFGYIAGPDIDDRIKWVVDSLVDVFLACNVEEILKDYGKATKMEDPIIHFYETFLSEYDPALRKARGVWYTPQPVVEFIVRAVDDILKTEFDLPMGLADTSKTKIKVRSQNFDKKKQEYKELEQEVHRVQILDPATGTGTFLAEVVKHIHKKFKGQQGIWSNYVETHLLPRLNGFELLMASYAMAHLQMDLLLKETGYKASGDKRFRIYLTNSLEEHHPDTGTLFANWLSGEANEANQIKRDTPVMCIIGNPPYSVSSSNNSDWIRNLIADYKKDLNERNIQPLSDDYIKFIRFGQHFIDKTGEGIIAVISNNSFIDGLIHRQMRKFLMEGFDKIYILDLHGNAKKKETNPEGGADQNVFDIMQGVSINIFIKKGKGNKVSEVFHYDLYGKRQEKYKFLNENSLKTINWNRLEPAMPNFFFVKKDDRGVDDYETGFKVDELFALNGMGITTGNDKELINFSLKELKSKFSMSNDFKKIYYRLFDERYINYDTKLVERAREKLMYHLLNNENIALISLKGVRNSLLSKFGITKLITDKSVISTLDNSYVFPLYLYPDSSDGLFTEAVRRPNLNMEIVEKIAQGLGLAFTAEKEPPSSTPLNLPKGETFPRPLSTLGEGNPPPVEKLGEGNPPPMEGLGEVKEVKEVEVKTPGYITANPITYKWIKEFRNTLKANPTEAEKIMWKHLRNKQLGHKIRRQHIIGDFITDFVCLRKKLVIEIDGKIHEKQKEYDELRTACLNDWGYTVIRFSNEEVFANPEVVAQKIKIALDEKADLQEDIEENSLAEDPEEYYISESLNPPPMEGQGEVKQGEVKLGEVKLGEVSTFAPIDLLDYIYAVLHSPNYRETYKEFLKIDFPRVPYPTDLKEFWRLVKIGGELRQLHLLESSKIEDYITEYPEDGDNIVSKPQYKEGKVYINATQYFSGVPESTWNFYIGGYQPAQKWLKDRKDRALGFEDILHYQKMIVALAETERLMGEVDK